MNWSEPGWYDEGGILPPSWSNVRNSGEPEYVATAEQIRRGLDYMHEHYGDDEEPKP